jgi:hypothetical protein
MHSPLNIPSDSSMDSASSEDELQERLIRAVRKDGSNLVCVDCEEQGPMFGSLIIPPPEAPQAIIGGLCCVDCAQAQRKLGDSVCRIKSLTMDDWTDKEVSAMEIGGNSNVNSIFEAKLASFSFSKPSNQSTTEEREAFIKAKYELKLLALQSAELVIEYRRIMDSGAGQAEDNEQLFEKHFSEMNDGVSHLEILSRSNGELLQDTAIDKVDKLPSMPQRGEAKSKVGSPPHLKSKVTEHSKNTSHSEHSDRSDQSAERHRWAAKGSRAITNSLQACEEGTTDDADDDDDIDDNDETQVRDAIISINAKGSEGHGRAKASRSDGKKKSRSSRHSSSKENLHRGSRKNSDSDGALDNITRHSARRSKPSNTTKRSSSAPEVPIEASKRKENKKKGSSSGTSPLSRFRKLSMSLSVDDGHREKRERRAPPRRTKSSSIDSTVLGRRSSLGTKEPMRGVQRSRSMAAESGSVNQMISKRRGSMSSSSSQRRGSMSSSSSHHSRRIASASSTGALQSYAKSGDGGEWDRDTEPMSLSIDVGPREKRERRAPPRRTKSSSTDFTALSRRSNRGTKEPLRGVLRSRSFAAESGSANQVFSKRRGSMSTSSSRHSRQIPSASSTGALQLCAKSRDGGESNRDMENPFLHELKLMQNKSVCETRSRSKRPNHDRHGDTETFLCLHDHRSSKHQSFGQSISRRGIRSSISFDGLDAFTAHSTGKMRSRGISSSGPRQGADFLSATSPWVAFDSELFQFQS